jgi:hypothetical protein
MGISKYTDKLADEIVARLSTGETLRSICRDKKMPIWTTVYDWMDRYPEFSLRIARARELGYDAIAEEALRIADTPILGETIKESKFGTEVTRADMLGHRKLQIETRLKLLAKWSPKRYGDTKQEDKEDKIVYVDNLEPDPNNG